MAQVKLNWTANPEAEQVTGYNVYGDGALIGVSPTTEFIAADVPPGAHVYEVAAVNKWGEGPKSDPASTPAAAGKVVGVSISINVTVNV
jgi:hypothetical protein